MAGRGRPQAGGRPAGEEARRRDHLLESRTGWHDIEKLADSAPAEFATTLWPIVVRIEERVRCASSSHTVRYAESGLVFARVDRREYVAYGSPDHFFLALDSAIRAFATADHARFWVFADAVGNPDSHLLQRMLCRGMRETVDADPGRTLAFLLADSRRFWLGGLHDEQGDSVELVQALAPHLGEPALAGLVAAIRGWAVYREVGGWFQEGEYARGRRFRLLAALPAARLEAKTRTLVEAERAELPEHVRVPRHRYGTGMWAIVSPVSHTEMTDRSDDDILALFDELPDGTGTEHPADRMVGGSVQASREFGDFAKAHPARAVGIIPRFRAADQQRPAAAGVRGLVDAGRPVGEVGLLVRGLDRASFTGHEFREDVASALDNLARANGLPDDLCALLEGWRTADWPGVNERAERGEPRDLSQPTSILWCHGGLVTLPHGRFTILSALTRGYLCRKPHAAERWLAVLESHLELDDPPATWQAMCLYLSNVHLVDRHRASAFLTRLYERYPSVAEGAMGRASWPKSAPSCPRKSGGGRSVGLGTGAATRGDRHSVSWLVCGTYSTPTTSGPATRSKPSSPMRTRTPPNGSGSRSSPRTRGTSPTSGAARPYYSVS